MNKLPKVKKGSKKRVGRGYGSGKGGHTSGRGQKGQKSRSNINILFEGVKVKKSLIKRLPLKRGKGKFSARPNPIIIKTDYLNIFPSGSKIDLDTLVNRGIVNEKEAMEYGVKILGNSKVGKKLTVVVPISKSAARGIEKAGGKVIMENSKVEGEKVKNR